MLEPFPIAITSSRNVQFLRHSDHFMENEEFAQKHDGKRKEPSNYSNPEKGMLVVVAFAGDFTLNWGESTERNHS